MNIERVIDGINRYIEREIYSKMNDWQEIFAKIAIGRLVGNKDNLKATLQNNAVLQTFAIIDSEGNVDIDSLAMDLKNQIAQKGKMELDIPMFGKFVFTASDVDKLYNTILEG